MSRNICRVLALLAFCAFAWPISQAAAQGVTTGAVTGVVTGPQGPVSGVSVLAVHVPSGSQYGALTRADGRYTIPNMRVGGPYRISVSHIGFQAAPRENVTVTLGTATKIDFTLTEQAVAIEGVTAVGQRGAIISPDRTGAQTTITREAIASLPSVSGRIVDIARLTPQSGGGLSFVGQDSRMNNITVDGSYFNNSFGLRSVPGETSGVAPISLSAIEQFQINIAPYDVRQGNFVGASVNTVTRSGTNDFRGSVYYALRNNSLVGTQAGANTFNPGTFDFSNLGGWVSGPIVKNKLFFFGSYEDESLTAPGTTFRANATGSEKIEGSVTRVKASDLDALSSFLKTNFNYDTGPYQNYDFVVPAKRLLAKLDFNVNTNNKLTVRYNMLNSSTDQLVSNSNSLGFGNRRTSLDALNFANSNYSILENIKSGVAELNTVVSGKMANNLIFGYTHQDESRGYKSAFFPFVDILEGGQTYTSFGFEPFTPNNELRYNTAQIQDNFTIFGNKHDLTFGFSGEKYNSENVFFQGAQSIYTYNSLADFYADANAFLNNADCKTNALSAACINRQSPITGTGLRIFQVGYNNIPTNEKPLQPLEVVFGGVFAQDEFRVNDNLKLTAGIRVEAPFFSQTGYDNPKADALTFRDENGNPVQYNTGKLPDAKPLFSPRLGFNFDARGDRSTQIRGGTGVFTGKPAYVWISNQIGNTGVLTGLSRLDNTRARPFNPDPGAYKPDPATLTGAPATSYALAVTDPDFKFPQVWRSNIGVDQKLPFGLIGTGEFIYNRDVNGIYYINANLPAAQTTFTGVDKRARWTGPGITTVLSCNSPTAGPCQNRINNATGNVVTSAVVLKNQNVGRSWNAAVSLEKPFSNGLFLKAAYSYGEAKNTVDPGSIAAGTWQNNPHSNDPNNPGLGYSANSPGKRLFATASYRKQWFKFGATTIGMFWERRDIGNASYTYSGDANGDGGTNDLIYISKDNSAAEMNFTAIPAVPATNTRAFTVDEQRVAWEAMIQQDPYLSAHRGEYAKRGEVWLPTVQRADLSFTQELFTSVAGKRNGISIRADIVNVGNLLNSDWGIGQRLVSTQPLTSPGVDATGAMTYRLRVIGTGPTAKLQTTTFEPTSGRSDVYEVQFRFIYTFN